MYKTNIEWASALVPPTLLLRRVPAERETGTLTPPNRVGLLGLHHFDLETPHHHA